MTNESPDIRTESEDCAENGGCTETRMDSIYKYLDGALDAQDFDEVRGHIEDCTECQSEHDLEIIIRDVVRRSCDEKAPQTLKNKIMDRIEELKTS
ncbi:MAG TPA: mycothiol system anti-sigma-R factor [Candidatus Yaniella excrementavium]|nr:mycothiol system anti-sigma-R factor [Candidatus Yaniella excrementavium]